MQIFKTITIVAFQLLLLGQASAQYKLTKGELADLAKQAERQVINFFDNVEQLGLNILKPDTQQKAINSVVKTFTPNGTVEERSKASKIGKTRKVREYLETIRMRGAIRKHLISYDIVDNITPNELIPYINADSSITYKGTLIVRQYYCRLILDDKITDNLSKNCEYSDTTTKKVHIEIRILKENLRRNMSWAVLIDKIVVLSVR